MMDHDDYWDDYEDNWDEDDYWDGYDGDGDGNDDDDGGGDDDDNDDEDDGEMFATAASRAATAPSTHRPQKLPEPEYARATFSSTTISIVSTIATNITCNINTTTIMVNNTTNTIW